MTSWRGERVVDVGCGDGALASLLISEGAVVTGVDPNQTAVGMARREFQRRGLKADLHDSLDRLASCTFDIAVCADVIEHVSAPKDLLRNIERVLRPGGMVVVSTPVRLTEAPIDTSHVYEYFPSELRELMQKHFQDVDIKFHVPMAGLMLYYWRPWFFLSRPIIAFVANCIDIAMGVNCVAGINALDRYHTVQVAVARKACT